MSCIPPRVYRCVWAWSPRHQRHVYHVVDVPHRAGIEIDAANFASQLLGCIALGRKVARFPNGVLGITNSRTSRDLLVRETGKRAFSLDIVELAAQDQDT